MELQLIIKCLFVLICSLEISEGEIVSQEKGLEIPVCHDIPE